MNQQSSHHSNTKTNQKTKKTKEKQFEVVYKDDQDLVEGNCLSYLFFQHLNKLARTYSKPTSDNTVELYRPPDDMIFANNKNNFLNYYSQWKTKNEMANKGPPRLWKVIFCFVFKYWKWGLFFMFLAQFIQACVPFLLRAFLDWIQDDEIDTRRGLLIVAGIAACTISRAYVNRRGRFNLFFAAGLIAGTFRAIVFDKITRMGPELRKHFTVGKASNLLLNDVMSIAQGCIFWHQMLTFPVILITYSIILYFDVGAIALVIPLIILITIFLQFFANKRATEWIRRKYLDADLRTTRINEFVKGVKIIKFNAWEKIAMKLIGSIRKMEDTKLVKIFRYLGLSDIPLELLPLNMALIIFGVYNNYFGQLTLGQTYSMLTIFNLIFLPTRKLNFSFNKILTGLVSISRFEKFLLIQDRVGSKDCKDLQLGELQLINLSASYSDPEIDKKIESEKSEKNGEKKAERNSQSLVLQNINLRAAAGEFFAVVGKVGSGKSSLILSCLNEIVIRKGECKKNGRIAYISQQAYLINDTVRENILFGAEYDEERYNKVIEACQLAPDLNSFPGRDLEEIGERGVNLSGGQKQRISIARAVYSDAEIFLIDDALSALDTYVGKEIFREVFEVLLAGKTRILVTHQLQYLPQVDRVVLIKGGRIVANAPFTALASDRDFVEFSRISKNTKKEQKKKKNSQKNQEQKNATKTILPKNEGDLKQGDKRKGPQKRKNKFQKNSENDEEEMKKKGKLIKTEKKLTGTISWSLYHFYLQNFGYGRFITVASLYMLFTLCKLTGDYWIGAWSVTRYNISTLTYTQVYLGIWLAFLIILSIRILVYSKLFANSTYKLNTRLFASLMKRPQEFFDTTPTGEILNRTNKEIAALDFDFGLFLHQYLYYMTFGFIALVVSVITSPFILIVLMVYLYAYKKVLKTLIAMTIEMQRIMKITDSRFISSFTEFMNNDILIHSLNRLEHFYSKFGYHCSVAVNALLHSVFCSLWGTLRVEIMVATFVGIVALIFALMKIFEVSAFTNAQNIGLAMTWSISVGELISFVVWAQFSVAVGLVNLENIKQYIENEEVVSSWDEPAPKAQNWPQKGVIEAKNIDVRYRKNLPLVLKKLSFKIAEREKVGVVGRTGSGKSTILLALTRILELDSGAITYSGEDISKIGLHHLRKNIIVIPQDPVLLAGSLKFNIDPWSEYGEEAIIDVLLKTGLEESMSSEAQPDPESNHNNHNSAEKKDRELKKPRSSDRLPLISARGGMVHKESPEPEIVRTRSRESILELLEFDIKDGGSNLSVGQRQLVCIARAMIKKPKVLLMDEATANIDTKTDNKIQRLIHKEFNESSIITIAHRIDTIINYDRLMILKDGSLLETGSPLGLLEDQGSYFRSIIDESGEDYLNELLEKARGD